MSNIRRSSNCASYTDTISTLVEGTAYIPNNDNPDCTVQLPPMFSCQLNNFEVADAVTEATLRDIGQRTLGAREGCPVADMQISYRNSLVGSHGSEYNPSQLAELHMTSNCFVEGNDPNHATHKASAVCHPMYDMTEIKTGRKVRDSSMTTTASLSTCDLSEGAMPQVYEDLRKVASHNLEQKGYRVGSYRELACKYSVLPQM